MRDSIEGVPHGGQEPRQHLVYEDAITKQKRALLRWDEIPWPRPLSDDLAEGLARAICEFLGVNAVLPFVNILIAEDYDARERVLRRAGAPTGRERQDKLNRLLGQTIPTCSTGEEPDRPLHVTQTKPNVSYDSEKQAVPTDQSRETPATPEPHELHRIENLFFDGEPVLIIQAPETPTHLSTRSSSARRTPEASSSTRSSYGNRTDLNALDRLGMEIAMRFEHRRIGNGKAANSNGRVFDVSHPEQILLARTASDVFSSSYDILVRDYGLKPDYPGFDILTLSENGQVERCIELKSSGVAARIQEMTWNEWKVSGGSLSRRFYLYLAGNLRADLMGVRPYLRTVRDPVAQLQAQQVEERSTRRKVQLRVDLFREAEEVHLDTRSR